MAGTCSVALCKPRDKAMRRPGSILRISCYERGHQPLGLASRSDSWNARGSPRRRWTSPSRRFDRHASFIGFTGAPIEMAYPLGVLNNVAIRPLCEIASGRVRFIR